LLKLWSAEHSVTLKKLQPSIFGPCVRACQQKRANERINFCQLASSSGGTGQGQQEVAPLPTEPLKSFDEQAKRKLKVASINLLVGAEDEKHLYAVESMSLDKEAHLVTESSSPTALWPLDPKPLISHSPPNRTLDRVKFTRCSLPFIDSAIVWDKWQCEDNTFEKWPGHHLAVCICGASLRDDWAPTRSVIGISLFWQKRKQVKRREKDSLSGVKRMMMQTSLLASAASLGSSPVNRAHVTDSSKRGQKENSTEREREGEKQERQGKSECDGRRRSKTKKVQESKDRLPENDDGAPTRTPPNRIHEAPLVGRKCKNIEHDIGYSEKWHLGSHYEWQKQGVRKGSQVSNSAWFCFRVALPATHSSASLRLCQTQRFDEDRRMRESYQISYQSSFMKIPKWFESKGRRQEEEEEKRPLVPYDHLSPERLSEPNSPHHSE
ncbi:hypothetical protein DNTS_021666, partial [Danionella cerebrum]